MITINISEIMQRKKYKKGKQNILAENVIRKSITIGNVAGKIVVIKISEQTINRGSWQQGG